MSDINVNAVTAARRAIFKKYFPEAFKKDGAQMEDDIPEITCPGAAAEYFKKDPEEYLRLLDEVLSVCAAVHSAKLGAEEGGRRPLTLDLYRNSRDHDDFIVRMDFVLGGPTVRAEYSSLDSRLVVVATSIPAEMQGAMYCKDGAAFDLFNEL